VPERVYAPGLNRPVWSQPLLHGFTVSPSQAKDRSAPMSETLASFFVKDLGSQRASTVLQGHEALGTQ